MPPKEQPSKKAVKAKKEKMIDESTFGLKNKNKSAKVQQFVKRVEKSVKNQSCGPDSVSTRVAGVAGTVALRVWGFRLMPCLCASVPLCQCR